MNTSEQERARCVRVLETMLREIDAEEDRAWLRARGVEGV